MHNEKEWFTESVLNCQTGLYNLAFGILKNEEDAKDAIQDTLYKAYDKLDSLKNTKKFKPWIMKILTNSAYEILRKRKDTVCIDEQFSIAAPEETDVNIKLTLWDAVQLLELQNRTVIVLFYYEDLSIKEISRITDLKPDAVKKRLSRARGQLKYLLEEKEVVKE